MKQLFFFLAVVGFVSCQNSSSKKEYQKVDTVLALVNGDNGPFLDSVIRITGVVRSFPDSGSLDGKLMPYTVYRLGQPLDTLRDALKHPLLDSLHHYTIHLSYPTTTVDTLYNNQIQVVKFPARKKK